MQVALILAPKRQIDIPGTYHQNHVLRSPDDLHLTSIYNKPRVVVTDHVHSAKAWHNCERSELSGVFNDTNFE